MKPIITIFLTKSFGEAWIFVFPFSPHFCIVVNVIQ